MCSLDRKQWANSRNAIGRKGQMMAIPTAINKTNNISGAVLLGHVLDFAMKKQQDKQRHDLLPLVDSNWFDNGTAASSSHIIRAASDATTVELLMPVWAYQTAAVYLICICVVGLIMNVIVVIVILNDPQVISRNCLIVSWLISLFRISVCDGCSSKKDKVKATLFPVLSLPCLFCERIRRKLCLTNAIGSILLLTELV